MTSSRKASVETVLQSKSSFNLYAAPGQTNLMNEKESTNSKIQILINDGESPKEEQQISNVRLEYRLKMKDLETLKLAFDSLQTDKEKQYKLSKYEFINLFQNYLNKGTEQEYDELFDNIDVNQSGFVDWDKFTSYLLMMLYESDDKLKAFSIPNWKPIKPIYNVHRDSIRRIEYVKNLSRYLTISKEGSCCIYDRNMNMSIHAKVNTDSCRSKDLWVTDFVVLQNVNKVVLAFTTKEIYIYELNTKLDFNCQYRLHGLKATPLCLDYWFDPANPNDSILIWGDTIGQVHKIHFNSALISLFERPSTNTNTIKSQNAINDTSLDIEIHEIKNIYKNASYFNYQAHTTWVRQVKWIKNLECIISCSTSSKQSVCMGWFIKKSSHVKANISVPLRAFERSSHLNILNGGVNAFDFDSKLNLLATANQNTLVNLFNPYVNEPNGILKGHSRVVLAVKFMPSRSQLISFSADKILRIWNVQLQICIQRIANIFPKGPDVEVACLYDEISARFLISFRYTLLMMEIKPEVTDRVLTHSSPVVCAKFHKNTNQVITLSQDGTLYMWLIESGQRVKTFTEMHGNAELTTMEFDETGTRIYSAAIDGTIKIWDLNGHCYHILEANYGQNCEINQVLNLKRRIISVGWKKSISIFRDNTLKEERVKPSEWKGKESHDDDILCIAIMKNPPMLLATGSFDGDIVLWNSVTELPYKNLSARKRILSAKQKEQDLGSRNTRNNKSFSRRLSKHENSNLTEAERSIKQNDFSYAITCLRFLNTRTFGKDCTLISCGGNGWVRFWEVTSSQLGAEFIAQQQVSSVIMEIDDTEKYLATGDVNGEVKVWDIKNYSLNFNHKSGLTTTEPSLVCKIKSHNDQISSINFCVKNDKTFVLLASSDCSVSLNDLKGNIIGIFGQDSHWKLEPNHSLRSTPSKLSTSSLSNNESIKNLIVPSMEFNSNLQVEDTSENQDLNLDSNENFFTKLNEKLSVESTFNFDDDAFVKDTTLRYNPWSKTILGKSYQEARVKKRDRKQPGFLQSEEFSVWDKTGQAPGGLYGSLQIIELEAIKNEPKKYEHKSQLRNGPQLNLQTEKNLAETLKSAFDEKSLFPKYILDYEARMRQEHKNILAKLSKESEHI